MSIAVTDWAAVGVAFWRACLSSVCEPSCLLLHKGIPKHFDFDGEFTMKAFLWKPVYSCFLQKWKSRPRVRKVLPVMFLLLRSISKASFFVFFFLGFFWSEQVWQISQQPQNHWWFSFSKLIWLPATDKSCSFWKDYCFWTLAGFSPKPVIVAV